MKFLHITPRTTRNFAGLFALALLLGPAPSLDAQTVPPDSQATGMLVGRWSVPADPNRILTSGGFIFNADGTFTSFMVLKSPDGEVRFDVEGKWKIEKGVLIEELTKSSDPKNIPIGLLTRDSLLNLTDKEYRFRNESGAEGYRTRRP